MATKTLSNGAIYDIDQGRIVQGAAITSSQASALARRRWDKQRQAAADGVVQAIRDAGLLPAIDDPDVGAWAVIHAKLTTLLLDTDNPRGAADLARFLGRSTDWLKDREEQPAVSLRLSQDAADRLADILQAVAERRQALAPADGQGGTDEG